jgi:hypothetical protein
MKVLITSLAQNLFGLFVGTFLVSSGAQAQAFLHAEADAYLKQRTFDPTLAIGEPVGQFVDLYPVMGQWTLIFEKDGAKRKVKCKDIWGFTYKGILFRIDEEGHIPVRLMTEREVCYYENGFAHLRMLRDTSEMAGFDYGHSAYLSKDIKGVIVPAVFAAEDDRSISGKFRTEYAGLEPLFKCIGATDDMTNIRQCVVDFEAQLEGNNE